MHRAESGSYKSSEILFFPSQTVVVNEIQGDSPANKSHVEVLGGCTGSRGRAALALASPELWQTELIEHWALWLSMHRTMVQMYLKDVQMYLKDVPLHFYF